MCATWTRSPRVRHVEGPRRYIATWRARRSTFHTQWRRRMFTTPTTTAATTTTTTSATTTTTTSATTTTTTAGAHHARVVGEQREEGVGYAHEAVVVRTDPLHPILVACS